jgi:hypothetical protein
MRILELLLQDLDQLFLPGVQAEPPLRLLAIGPNVANVEFSLCSLYRRLCCSLCNRTYGREAATGPNKRVACIVDIGLLKRCPGNSLENHLQNPLLGFQSRAKVPAPVILRTLPCAVQGI